MRRRIIKKEIFTAQGISGINSGDTRACILLACGHEKLMSGASVPKRWTDCWHCQPGDKVKYLVGDEIPFSQEKLCIRCGKQNVGIFHACFLYYGDEPVAEASRTRNKESEEA